VLPLVGGRGGGQKSLAQGGGPEVTGLDAALAAARAAILG
jgi:alanyl-tRNA synthetase